MTISPSLFMGKSHSKLKHNKMEKGKSKSFYFSKQTDRIPYTKEKWWWPGSAFRVTGNDWKNPVFEPMEEDEEKEEIKEKIKRKRVRKKKREK